MTSSELDPFDRQVAMRIKLGFDETLRADERAHALQYVAFDIVIAMGHHGTVKSEKDAIDRQSRLELSQDLISHKLVALAIGGACGRGSEATPFAKREALPGSGAALPTAATYT